jgi:hypothetical protein
VGDEEAYAGRRARQNPASSPGGPDDPHHQSSHAPAGVSRGVQMLVVLVVAVPAAVVGVELGMSTPLASVGRLDTTREPLPSFTVPGPLPTISLGGITPSRIPDQAPASGSPTASVRTPDPDPPPPDLVPLVVDNFDGSPPWYRSENDLGKATQADAFANGPGNGDGVVGAGGLTLVYRDDGWFGSDVMTDVSRYTHLVLRIAGLAGGEQRHFTLSLGGVEKRFADFTLDGGAHPAVTTSYQDIRIPMAANGINARSPGELGMTFWWGGYSTIVIDEIRFE